MQHDEKSAFDQEGGQTMAPPAFQLFSSPEAPPTNPPEAPQNPNDTGLPDQLKTGIEQLSGHDMSDVKVHYNSDKPAQLQAHAYAQGSEIHLGAGQEKHLPHEAWHVVQQKQGRVNANTQLKGLGINDDSGLEQEATVMGEKAMQLQKSTTDKPLQAKKVDNAAIQRMVVQVVPALPEPKKEEKKEEEKKEEETSSPISILSEDSSLEGKDDSEEVEMKDLDETTNEKETNSETSETTDELKPMDVDVDEELKKVEKDSDTKSTTELNSDSLKPIDSTDSMDVDPESDTKVESKEVDQTEKKEKKQARNKVKYDEDNILIADIHIIGRPKQLFSGSMGDHTTAFGVHVAGIKLGLKGMNARGAKKYMHTLYEKAKALPGYAMKRGDKKLAVAQKALEDSLSSMRRNPKNLSEKGKQAVRMFRLQTCIEDYLEFRETIPLSAINVAAKSKVAAGKGKGEAVHIQTLSDWEEYDRSPSLLDLTKAVLGTFDPDAAAMTIIEKDSKLLPAMAPGFKKGMETQEAVDLFVASHLQSLEMSFPKTFQNAKDDVEKLKQTMRNLIFESVSSHATYEKESAESQLKSVEKELKKIAEEKELDAGALNEKISVERTFFEKTTNKNDIVEDDAGEMRITLQDYYDHLVKAPKSKKKKQNKIVSMRTTLLNETSGLLQKDQNKAPEELIALLSDENDVSTDKDSDTSTTGSDDKSELKEELFASETQTKAAAEALELDDEERRQAQGLAIVFDSKHEITKIKFGGRPASPFSGTMGAHTTAWVAITDWVKEILIGKKVGEAVTLLNSKLFKRAKKKENDMFSALGIGVKDSFENITGYSEEKLKGAQKAYEIAFELTEKEDVSMQQLLLQQLVSLFLAYYNMIPGSTIDKSDTSGKKERSAVGALRRQKKRNNGKKEKTTKLSPLNNRMLELYDGVGFPEEYDGSESVLKSFHKDVMKDTYGLEWNMKEKVSPKRKNLDGLEDEINPKPVKRKKVESDEE